MGFAQKKSLQSRQLQPGQLKEFVPIFSLDSERLQELARHAKLISLPSGAKLFSRGDTDNHIFYLMNGSIEARNNEQRIIIHSGSDDALMPLDPHQPRQFTVTTKSDSDIVVIDHSLLEILLAWDPYSNYSVNELNEDPDTEQDWMSVLLRSKIFQKIPPVNIQIMFQKLQHVPVQAGDVIFYEGERGEDCYFIRSGECEVIRLSAENELAVVATLSQGQGFGEEALLSNSTRNATLRMRSDGTLLKLNKEDFEGLLKTPVIRHIDFETAENLRASGAIWVDVRQLEEHQANCIPGSLHISLGTLRDAMRDLNPDNTYLLYCDNGQRSSCAAYLLNAFGFDAFVLEDGMQSLDELLI